MVKIEKIGSEEIAAAVKENDGYCPCMRTKLLIQNVCVKNLEI